MKNVNNIERKEISEELVYSRFKEPNIYQQLQSWQNESDLRYERR